MHEVREFLESQKLLVLSTVDESGNPWTSNVYFSIDKDTNIFFVSPAFTKHVKHIEISPNVSFSVAWFDPDNLVNRKAVQGTGICKRLKDTTKTTSLIKNHVKFYPLWKDVITLENIDNKVIKSKPYVIEPNYMKFWNDELYGEEGTKEFNLK